MSVHDREGVTRLVLRDLADERVRQDATWGVQDHPDGHAPALSHALALRVRQECVAADGDGTVTWRHILDEEWAEVLSALADRDVDALRKELVQVGAVAVAWIECLDRRKP